MLFRFNQKTFGICVLAVLWAMIALKTTFGLSDLKNFQLELNLQYQNQPYLTVLVFFIIYLLSTSLSLPVASILTVAAGAVFGFWEGLAIVSFASTLGATLAFEISRRFLKDSVQQRFANQLKEINLGIQTEGSYYLFGLRLSPIFPFFLVNLMMGLTPMSTKTFYWVSQLGMLPGTALYVNAGAQLAKLESLKNILSPRIILSLTLLGIFPVLAKKILKK